MKEYLIVGLGSFIGGFIALKLFRREFHIGN
jgi:hypothetical protein